MYIQKRSDGRYRAQVKHAGRRQWTPIVDTKAEARRLAAELVIELGAGGRRAERRVTVGEMLLTHLAEQAGSWSPTYHHDATTVVERLIEDHGTFTSREVRTVTTSVLLALHRELAKKSWTRWRVKRLHTVMGTAWQMAISYEWTTSNPCRLIAPPTPEAANVNPPTDDQVRAILAELDGLELLAVRLNSTLGIRRGDVVGLQWTDVDFDRAEILIARSLAHTPGQIHVMPTKAGKRSHRRLALDLPTLTMLRRWKAEQAAKAFANGLPAPVWIMSSDAGITPWRPDRVSRVFRHVVRRIGAHGIRLHDLRHYVATSMLNDGESVHDVAGLLGNTPAVVESTYRHWLPGRGRDSVTARAARLDASG
jgi:integrase